MEISILVNTKPNTLWGVAEGALKIDGVKMAHAVTGQVDAVVLVEFAKMEYLAEIIDRIQQLKGVQRTQTLMAIPRPIRE